MWVLGACDPCWEEKISEFSVEDSSISYGRWVDRYVRGEISFSVVVLLPANFIARARCHPYASTQATIHASLHKSLRLTG